MFKKSKLLYTVAAITLMTGCSYFGSMEPSLMWMSTNRVTVGDAATLQVSTNLGSVSYAVKTEDLVRARIEGDRLIGLAEGPVRISATAGGKTVWSLGAVIARDAAFTQLMPSLEAQGTVHGRAYMVGNRTELESFHRDLGVSAEDLATQSLLLFGTCSRTGGAVGTGLKIEGDKAVVSVVIPASDRLGVGLAASRCTLDRFLLPKSIASASIVVTSWDKSQSGLPALATTSIEATKP